MLKNSEINMENFHILKVSIIRESFACDSILVKISFQKIIIWECKGSNISEMMLKNM